MPGELIDFTGKDLPEGASLGTPPAKPTLIDFTGKEVPAGAKVGSKFPEILKPAEAAEGIAKGVESAVVPHDETQAWLSILGAGLPFVGKAAPLLEDIGGPLAKGAEYLASKGL